MNNSLYSTKGWLGFELNVLRRLEFRSIAIPFCDDPALGVYLKRRDIKVLANDMLQSSWNSCVAAIQNNNERLSDDDVNSVLEDVYIPRHKLLNPSLRNWFSETDSWWFDNVRINLDQIPSPFGFAIAADLVMLIGDYVHSFDDDNGDLRQPLSTVFRRLWSMLREPVNNGLNNACQNKIADDFIAESNSEAMFLKLPTSSAAGRVQLSRALQWREEWLRGGAEFWPAFEAAQKGRLGSSVETRSQYLSILETTLDRASHIKTWAVSLTDNGLVSVQDIVGTVEKYRRVEKIYTKDFSELTGTRQTIITA